MKQFLLLLIISGHLYGQGISRKCYDTIYRAMDTHYLDLPADQGRQAAFEKSIDDQNKWINDELKKGAILLAPVDGTGTPSGIILPHKCPSNPKKKKAASYTGELLKTKDSVFVYDGEKWYPITDSTGDPDIDFIILKNKHNAKRGKVETKMDSLVWDGILWHSPKDSCWIDNQGDSIIYHLSKNSKINVCFIGTHDAIGNPVNYGAIQHQTPDTVYIDNTSADIGIYFGVKPWYSGDHWWKWLGFGIGCAAVLIFAVAAIIAFSIRKIDLQ